MSVENQNVQESGSSPAGAPRQGPLEGSILGEIHGSGASEEATGPESSSANLECLAEKVGTLGLQRRKKNQCGAAKRRAGRARLEMAGGQAPRPPGGQPQ
jgi:hypothetical protein